MTDNTTIDAGRMERFMGQVVSDMAASMSVMMTDLGGKLGLYKGRRRRSACARLP